MFLTKKLRLIIVINVRDRVTKIILCTVFLCLAISCGKRIKNHKTSALKSSPIEYSQEDFTIDCHSGAGGCPEYIAYIKSEQSSCNAVLVDDGLLITSGHCFESKNAKNLCENLEVIFPATKDHDFQKLKCHNIVFSKSQGSIKKDIERDSSNYKRLTPANVIYIQVSTTGRKPVKINSSFNLDQSLKIQSYSFDTAYQNELFFHDRECYVSLRTYASPLYSIRKIAPAVLTNCLGKNEERGAPILNSNGELVALNGSLFTEEDAQGLINKVDSTSEKSIRSVFIAQKIACLDIKNHTTNIACHNILDLDEMNQGIHNLFLDTIDKVSIEDMTTYLDQESLINWKRVTLQSSLHWSHENAFKIIHKPICKRANNLPRFIPSFEPRLKIKHGWRLDIGFIYQSTPFDYNSDEIKNCP